MNNDELIRTALERRFARVSVPSCPESAWRATATAPAASVRSSGFARRYAYAAAALLAVVIAGLTAQAAPIIKQGYANLVGPRFLFVSSKPLTPLIHASERLTIADAQRQMPFTIVEPVGLPAGTQFLYAHVLSRNPVPSVALTYQAHVASTYYRIAITESTKDLTESTQSHGPPVGHFQVRTLGGGTKTWTRRGTKTWTRPLRRWKHGTIIMTMPDWGLPPAMSAAIVRANTQ
jgi:hypothetical protein